MLVKKTALLYCCLQIALQPVNLLFQLINSGLQLLRFIPANRPFSESHYAKYILTQDKN